MGSVPTPLKCRVWELMEVEEVMKGRKVSAGRLLLACLVHLLWRHSSHRHGTPARLTFCDPQHSEASAHPPV